MTPPQSRPIIGIVISPPEDGSPMCNLNPEYPAAVWRAGAVPLAIPLLPHEEFGDHLLPMIDGLLLTGSAYDLDPARYGEEEKFENRGINSERDETDAMLLSRALGARMPILGICHGCQAINVAMGGTLVQDIPGEYGDEIDHRAPSGTGEYIHEVVFEPGSILNASHEVIRARTNSAHHQSIDRVGDGLKVVACTSDGVIEAVEGALPQSHFILGVQWHPERLAAGDDFALKPFEALTAAARAWRASNRG